MRRARQDEPLEHPGKLLRAPLDSGARPAGLPAPWDALHWQPLAPYRNQAKARLFWAQDGDRRLVCKDGSLALRRPVVGRFRRWALANEARALDGMAGIAGVPRLIARWPSGLVMEFVPGRMLTEYARGSVPHSVFEQLEGIVAAIHAAHFTIGDLHRRNILVDEQHGVHLVDFELAQDRRRGVGRLVGAQLARLDRLAVARQRQYHGARLDAEQAALLARRPLPYRIVKQLRRWLRAARRRRAR